MHHGIKSTLPNPKTQNPQSNHRPFSPTTVVCETGPKAENPSAEAREANAVLSPPIEYKKPVPVGYNGSRVCPPKTKTPGRVVM